LQAKMEALENTPQQTVFSVGLRPSDAQFQIGPPTREGLSVAAWENWFLKHRFELYRQFIDRLSISTSADASDQQMLTRIREQLQQNMQEDQIYWHGWWERHQYHLDFLGDDAAVYAGVLPWLLWCLFAGLLLLLARELRVPRPKSAPVATRVVSRSRR